MQGLKQNNNSMLLHVCYYFIIELILGTTEKIFESKPQLYDVYVDNQNITTPSKILQDLLKFSQGDLDKLHKLKTQK